MLCSCAKATPDEVLAHADEAIARGEAVTAVEFCQSLDMDGLTPTQLCHSSLIYAKASQIDNSPEHMATAAQCLKRAIDVQADSVSTYISTLPFADMAIISEVYSLSKFNPDSVSIEDYSDLYDEEIDADH